MNIAIWGTGDVGKYIYQKVADNPNYTVRYFIDSNAALWGTKVNGIEVISPKQLQKDFLNELEFVLVAFLNGISIYKELLKMQGGVFGIVRNKVFSGELGLADDLRMDRNIFWSDAPYLDKPLLESVETNIVDYCNLNCRGCSHFSNLYSYGEKIPFAVFCKDLQRVAEHVYVYQCSLLGGEALLDADIIDYMEFARKALPDSEIQLVTNGLLLPKQSQDFYQCCRDNDITISVSGYKPTLALKDKILEILDSQQVTYLFRINKEEFGKNIDLTGTADQKEAVKRCREHICHFLRNGKIYKCPFEALGNKLFEYYDLEIRFHGGVDIYNDQLDWSVLADTLSSAPVDACRYCGIEEKIGWGVTNSPVLEDWVVKKSL